MNKDNTVRQAGGFIIQLLPYADEKVITVLEQKLKDLKPITQLLDNDATPETILEEILGEFDLEILDKVDTKFECDCSEEKVKKTIASLSKKEIKDMVDDNKPIEVNCHFCNKNYSISVDELKAML